MKKALINPNTDNFLVCEVAEESFEVAPPLFWVDCADEVTAYNYYFDTVEQAMKPIERHPEPVQSTVHVSFQGTQNL